MVCLLLQEAEGDELREVGVLVARLLERPVQVALRGAGRRHASRRQRGGQPGWLGGRGRPALPCPALPCTRSRRWHAAALPASPAPLRVAAGGGFLLPHAARCAHLHPLPYRISVGSDDHGASHGAIVCQLALTHHIQVPPVARCGRSRARQALGGSRRVHACAHACVGMSHSKGAHEKERVLAAQHACGTQAQEGG